MAERRAAAKGRRMGSSRRKQLREGSGEAPAAAPGPSEELPWASEIVQRVQNFFREWDKDQTGFVTRSDMQKLQEEDLPCSTEELELVFDGLDAAGTGRLSTEEFTTALWQFLSSQKAARDHRRRKTASRRVRLVVPRPALEGVDSEERRQFAAFMDQLGTDNVSEEQEVWQLWVKLRQDEPQLLGNLEDFLAKMRHRIQEARSKKEALEVTLNKHVAEHDKEVQQLCEALEQQIQQEQQRLEQESMARSQQHSMELQQALDASEREVQRLVTAQMELETRCRSLRSMQQAASTENRQLEESNRVLEDRLEHLHQQLQQTHELLRTARAAMAREHVEEPGDRAVAELPGKMSLSPQMSLEKSEKNHSEMRIRLGTQGTEPKAKSTHHVVWEILPAETSVLGPPPRASSTEEDPFPEFLKEERFSDQSSLLTEMNDAIAALSKQLRPQTPGAPPAPADATRHPQDDAEPQTGLEAAAAHGTTPGILQETLPSHVGHELFEGDLKEGQATAELRAPDMTQAGASTGAGHCRAQEPGAEQGESPEEARRMLFLQGKGAGEKELMLKAVEHLQGAPGESMEAGEQALMEVEGEGWMQEKTGWEEAEVLGEAEEVALNQGENPEAGLGPPETREGGLAAGWQLATDELGPAAAPEERAQPLGTGPGEEAELPSGLSEELEIKPGERLEPKPPSRGEVRMGAAQGDGVLPEVTEAPDPGMLEEERVDAEVQPWGETLDADVPPAPAQRGGSSRAGAEEGEVEVTQPREAEPRPRGESARGDAAWGGSTGAEGLLPPADVQEGGVGTDVQALEAQSSDADVQLLAEVEELKASTEADLQPPSEAGSLDTEQGGSVAPGVQPLDLVHDPELVEMVEAEDLQADTELRGGASPETLQGRGDRAARQLVEEAEDGAQGQDEHGLPHEPVLHPHGVTVRQGEGAPEGVQLPEEAESLGTLEDQSPDANAQLLAEVDELRWTPGGSTEADLRPPSEAGSPGTEQGGSVAPGVQPRDQLDKPELGLGEEMGAAAVHGEGPSPAETPAGSLDLGGLFPVKAQALELVGAEEPQADTQLHGGASAEAPRGGGDHAAAQLGEEAEDGGGGQGERELPHEPVMDLRGAGFGQGEEGAGADGQPREEAVILDVLEERSSDANVQLLAEAEELKWTPGGSMEADLEPHSKAGSLDTEQGGSVAPDVQLPDQDDKPEVVEMVEAEVSWADTQLRGGASSETPQECGDRAARQLVEEAEDGAEGQDERGLPREPVLHPHGVTVRQGEGATEGVQPWEEAVILEMVKGQSPDANVQPLAEVDELRWTPGGSTEADLQPPSEAGSPGTEQGGSVAPGVQPRDQLDKPELGLGEEMGAAAVHGEGPSPAETPAGSLDLGGLFPVKAQALELVGAEEPQADMQLRGGASAEAPRGGGDHAAAQLGEEAEDGGRGQGEHELPHEPVMDLRGAGFGQGEEGAGAEKQPGAEGDERGAGRGDPAPLHLGPFGVQRPGAEVDGDVQHPEEEGERELAPGEGINQDGLFPVKAQALELAESEDSWADTQLRGGASPETPQGGEGEAAVQLGEEAEDGGRGQGERELPREPVMDLRGAGFGQGEEGAGANVQPWEEAVILDVLEDRSPDANVQLLAEVDELKLTPGGSTEADLEPHSKAGSRDTEQGGSVAPDVQLPDQDDKPELVEMVEAEVSWADTQLRGGASSETPQEWGDRAARQLVEEAEDGAEGQDERGLPREPVLHPHGVTVRQGEGAPEGVQLPEEAESLGTLEDQSPDANAQLLAEVDELRWTPGGSTEADLRPPSEAGSPGTEQGGSVAPGVQPRDQLDKPELGLGEEMGAAAVHGEGPSPAETPAGSLDLGGLFPVKAQALELVGAEEPQADTQLHGGASAEAPRGGGDHAAAQLGEEAEDGGGGQGERELPHEPVMDLRGAGFGQGEEGAGADGQPREEAVILDVLEERSSDANVQLLAEAEELKWTPGGSMEADLEPHSKAGSLDTEQGGSVAPDVQLPDQDDKPEVVEMVEAEVSWADTQLRGGASSETPQECGDRAARQLVEEAEDGAEGQDERGLPREPVLHPHGVTVRQGEGATEGVQPWEEAVILEMVKGQSPDANVQPLAEVDELRWTPGGSTEADLQPPSEAGSPGTEQGGSVAPGVQPRDQLDKPELGLGEEMGAAAVHGEGPSPAETPAGSLDLGGLFPVKAQALELVGAEEPQADMQLRGGASAEAPRGGGDHAAAQLGEEAEDGGRGQGEHELPHEPVMDLRGAGFGQGEEGAGAEKQPGAEGDERGAGRGDPAPLHLGPFGVQRPGAEVDGDVQHPEEEGERELAPGEGINQDGLFPVKAQALELAESEDSWADTQLRGGASPETPQGGEGEAAVQLGEEAEDGGRGQGERELPREPVMDLRGAGFGQGEEGAGANVQPWEEAVILDVLEDRSPDANVQLLAEVDELKLTPGGSTEADLEPHSKAGSRDTEQGGSVAPDVQLPDQDDKPELVEMVEAEVSWADTQLRGGASSETPQEWGDRAARQLVEEAEDGAEGQDERGLPREPVLHPHGVTVRQGEGATEGVQPWEEAVILEMVKGQSPDANVQPLAEVDELKLTPGGSTEADLQPLSEAGSLDTEQGGSVAPGVQPLDLVHDPELVEMVEAEDLQADTELRGGASPETLQGRGDRAARQLVEEAEHGAQRQDERGLPHEPVLHPHGVTVRQGEGAPEGVQPWEEAVILEMVKGQSPDANVQLIAEVDELKLTPGGSTEADLEPHSEAGSRDTEQGGSVAPDVQLPDQDDKPELVEMVEGEDSWADTQLRGGASSETPQEWGDRAARQLVEDAEDGAQGQDERGLPHEPVLDPQGAGVGQGEEGAGADGQPREEAVILDVLEDRSPDANVQLLAEAEELKLTPGGSMEADLAPLGAAGMREGEQSQAPGLDAGLCAAHTADVWEGAAGAPLSPPAEAALHPEHAAAAGGPGLEAMLGALAGPDWQILEDAQTLAIAQGERADAEERALDGALGLEVARGERLEAGARALVETQSLGIKQGHDDGASALAPPVSEVTLQISTLKLETMMQEDVLVPDVWRLGASEQAAQSELQEQVSAQADKVRLHAASQQSEEKLPHVMETEQVAAGPAKPPKQEVPPALTLHTRVQQEEDAGNDQLGMVLRDSSLGDAANSSMPSQRQLLGEQNKDLSIGQQEKMQEVGWKMSQEGEPSSGEPGAVTADGAGAAPRGSPEASLDPDHLYNLLFVGDSHVGKTSFLYRLHADTFNPHLTTTVGLDYQVKNLVVDNKRFAIRLWDSAGQERYHSITKQFFRKADGVVLMYDITSEYSFSNVRYWLSCIQDGAEDGVAILLLGNKTDCAAERQVPTKEGERLAKEHQLMFYECSAASGHNVCESMVSLIRLLKVREDELKNKAEEVPKPPQKKKGCC